MRLLGEQDLALFDALVEYDAVRVLDVHRARTAFDTQRRDIGHWSTSQIQDCIYAFVLERLNYQITPIGLGHAGLRLMMIVNVAMTADRGGDSQEVTDHGWD